MRNKFLGIVFFLLATLFSCNERRNPIQISQNHLYGTWKLNYSGGILRTLVFNQDGTGCATNIRPKDLGGTCISFWILNQNGAKRIENCEYIDHDLPHDFVWKYETYEYKGRPAASVQLFFTIESRVENNSRLVFRQQGTFDVENNCVELRFYEEEERDEFDIPKYATYLKL